MAIGAALAAAAPGWATTTLSTEITTGTKVTYTFALDSGSVNSGSSYGNTRTFDETVKDKSGDLFTLNVTASAWTATKVGSTTTYSVSDSYLGQWAGGGLGVINRNEGNGDNNSHQIDNNINGTDFILLEFDRPVTLSSLTTLAYPMKNSSGSTLTIDNDVAISSKMPVTSQTAVTTTTTKVETIKNNKVTNTSTSSSSAAPVTTTGTTSTTTELRTVEAKTGTQSSSTGTATVTSTTSGSTTTKTTKTPTTVTTYNAPTVNAGDFTEKSQSKTTNSNGTVSGSVILSATAVPASKTWLVAASFTNQDGMTMKPDGFKVSSLQVSWSAVVPEPSTWAMMIVGFGFVGCAARRQRRMAAAA